MFTEFFFQLRQFGLKPTTTEWLALMKALALGHGRAHLNTFYHLWLVVCWSNAKMTTTPLTAHSLRFSMELNTTLDITDELLDWLKDPIMPEITEEQRAMLEAMDLDELRKRFEDTLPRAGRTARWWQSMDRHRWYVAAGAWRSQPGWHSCRWTRRWSVGRADR